MHSFTSDRAVGVLQALALGCLVAVLALPYFQRTDGRASALQTSGELTYSAPTTASQTYPDGQATSPQPIYTRMVDDVDFTYTFKAPGGSQLTQAQSSLEVVFEDVNGYERTIVLKGNERAETGPAVTVRGQLDLDAATGMLAQIRQETGLASPNYIVHVRPSVMATITADGKTFDHSFTDDIEFKLTPSALTPVGELAGTSNIAGSAKAGAAVLAAGPITASVSDVRTVLLILAALMGMAAMTVHVMRLSQREQEIDDLYDDEFEMDTQGYSIEPDWTIDQEPSAR